MGVSVNLDEALVDQARSQAKIMHRSIAKQIEHWAKMGHMAEENPDLTYSQIKEILLGLQDHAEGMVSDINK